MGGGIGSDEGMRSEYPLGVVIVFPGCQMLLGTERKPALLSRNGRIKA